MQTTKSLTFNRGSKVAMYRCPFSLPFPGDGEDTECEFDVAFEWRLDLVVGLELSRWYY